jgi:phage shock protein A
MIAGLFALYQQRQAIYDWTRLRNYDPPPAVVQLASDTTMNDSARHLFYVYHPQLNNRDQFSQNCTNVGEQTIVLGCYVSRTGIYLFDIDDPRLEGVEQVTAAHEMLHAAYERLDTEERSRIDNLTQQTLNALADQRIRDTIENYRKKDPSVVPNELHSIIGTEVRSLPPELEAYYQRYFTNRAQIVGFSEKYEGVLTARRQHAEALEAQIKALRAQIEQLEDTLTAERADLQRDRAGVDTQAEVTEYNARVGAYNAEIRHFNNLVAEHNNLVKEHEANALEEQSLFKALDSRPTL